jgi:hypothetical protein
MIPDPALSALRAARCEISHEFGNDATRLLAHYYRLQSMFKGRLIAGSESAAAPQDVEPDGTVPSPLVASRSR